MIVKKNDKSFVSNAPGICRKTLATGEKSMMIKFIMEEGAVVPSHSHPHEQIGYLLEGQIVLIVDGQEYTVNSGDSWVIPGGVEHAERVYQKAEVVEVFVPIRLDYLD